MKARISTQGVKQLLGLLFIAVLLVSTAFAQSPSKMSYQSVIRDGNENLLRNQAIGMQISIIVGAPDSTAVYVETHSTTSNTNGLVSLEIGAGTVVSGEIDTIDWANGPYFIKTEIDPAGASNYTITGNSQLISVPYALYATSSGSSTPGPQGAKGDQGLSAYQVWLNLGNTGTEMEFIASLTGPKGDTGNGLPDTTDANNLITFDGTNWVAKKAVIQNAGGGQDQNNLSPYLGIHHVIALQGLFPSRNAETPYIGEILMVGFNFAPRGWAFCDGQLLAINQNTALFSLLGTIYGGDGRTTFALPDLRGRTAIHPGQGPGLRNYRLGEKGGQENTIMTINQMPVHNHVISYQ